MTVTVEAIRWARLQRPKGSDGVSRQAAAHVLLLLADNANGEGRAWPTVATLASDSCLDERQVRRALHALESEGLIADSGDRRGQTRQVRVWTVKTDSLSGYKADTLSRKTDTLSRKTDRQSGFSKEGTTREPPGNLRARARGTNSRPKVRPQLDASDVPEAIRDHVARIAGKTL